MKTLFEQLPGISMPVAEITQALAHMWDGDGEENILSKTHATQVNLILHIGEDAEIETALQSFQTAVSFAQNYPCRIIVVCPLKNADTSLMSAKLYSQCFIGSDFRETCCCEALILAHNEQDYTFLDSQISTWLEPDLPVFYWFHGISPKRICNHARFLKHCSRIIYDSATETPDCSKHNWPKPNKIQDLAKARILPWRQSIGQILAAHSPIELVTNLKQIEIRYSSQTSAEAKCLLEWIQNSLKECYTHSNLKTSIGVKSLLTERDEENLIEVEWSYENDKRFLWSHKTDSSSGHLNIKMDSHSSQESIYIRDLKPHQVLSEALYFNS